MICPNCNYQCEDTDRFCCHCGTALCVPAQKKGRHWVPILIMVLLCVLGIGMFFMLPGGSSTSRAHGLSVEEMPWFCVDDGILYFSPADYNGGSELQIPASIGGEAIEVISEGCFENCAELTAIFLPETLTAIGEDAFRGCTSLRGMKIPDSVTFIGEGAFSGCSALEAVSISSGVDFIGSGAFDDCHKLYYIYYLGNYADWTELYREFISPYTTVFCEDGSFYHGGDAY